MKTDAERTALAPPEPDAKAGRERRKHPILHSLGELPGLILVALVLAILIKTFLFQAFYIPSPSMEKTLLIGDRVLVTKIPYYFRDPRRGDIIVFEDPKPKSQQSQSVIGGFFHWMFQGLGVQKPENEDFIKRVIGVPGDTVWAKDGTVYVNGLGISEPYLTQKTKDFPRTKVPPDSYFVMGDNRGNSLDSRFGLGFIPRDKIVGEAFAIVWPPDRWAGV